MASRVQMNYANKTEVLTLKEGITNCIFKLRIYFPEKIATKIAQHVVQQYLPSHVLPEIKL